MNTDQLNLYDVDTMQNCKPFTFRRNEIYPSIAPPVARYCQEQSTMWLSKAIEDSGCKPFHPRLNTIVPKNTPEARFMQKGIDNPCNTRRYVSNQGQLPSRELDYSKVTPYEAMRMINCKMESFRQWEKYPSIRPPVSQCSPAQTAEWLANAIEDNGCGRLFDMQHDDIIEVWKRSPDKDTLGYYGVGSAIHKPEAVAFNQVLTKCLKEVSPPKPIVAKPTPVPRESRENPKQPSGAFVLNRQMLKTKVSAMPTVQETLAASKALKWLHCPHFLKNKYPFLKSEPHVTPAVAFDGERPPSKPKHGLRRKHVYCELECGIPTNQCTEYEWHKYKQDPVPYEVAFQKEVEQLEAEIIEEPKNYEELYSQLVTCFKKVTSKDPLSEAYKCCMEGLKQGDGGGDGDGRPSDVDSGANEGDIGSGDGGKIDKPSTKKKRKKPGSDINKQPSNLKMKDHRYSQFSITSRDGSEKCYEHEPSSSSDSDKRKRRKRKRRKMRPKDGGKISTGDKPDEDCPCEVCERLKRPTREPDSPLIRQMKEEQKRRELRDYYKRICHRNYIKCRKPQYPAPQHKCDPIECDNSFCNNPKLGEYCDCLNAISQLQKLLGPQHCTVDNEILFNVSALKNRINRRLCECLQQQCCQELS